MRNGVAGSRGRLAWMFPLRASTLGIAVLAAWLCGCQGESERPQKKARQQQLAELYDRALVMLAEAERYNETFEDVRLLDGGTQRRRIERFHTPETLDKVVFHLNQWVENQEPRGDWQADPLLNTLPAELRTNTTVFRVINDLSKLQFAQDSNCTALHDGWQLQQALWMRDVSARVQGDQVDELTRATRIFDWTIRNIQLEGGHPSDVWQEDGKEFRYLPKRPWHSLLIGSGQAAHRSWIFILLCRQQGLDAVQLAYPDPGDPAKHRPWGVGLLLKDQIYLFDPRLGLPIPGPQGKGVATLEQAAADASVLKQLNLPDEPYPVNAETLKQGVLAWIEASPIFLSRRMELLQGHASGDKRLVLSVNASGLAKRLEACQHVLEARLWTLPYETIRDLAGNREVYFRVDSLLDRFRTPYATLWNARVAHLRGDFVSDRGANRLYLKVRAEARSPRWTRDSRIASDQLAFIRICLDEARQSASYWLAHVAYDRENYDAAITHFLERSLGEYPDGIFANGARYNLGRSYEMLSDAQQAASWYSKVAPPAQAAALLRSQQLKTAAR